MTSPTSPRTPPLVDLAAPLRGTAWGWLAPAARLIERRLAIPYLNRLYSSITTAADRGDSFWRRALRAMDAGYNLPAEDWPRVPATGPLVVVANHPTGAFEALALGDALEQIRPDVRFLGNSLLSRVPELRDRVIAVDPFGGPAAARANLQGLRAALRHLHGGGALVVFPAGSVSHLHLRQMTVTDPPWSPHVARLIKISGATVVAAYLDARNSWLFQLAGLAHPLLRTLLLPIELQRRHGREMRMFLSRPISPAMVARHSDDRKLLDFLRAAVYVQQGRAGGNGQSSAAAAMECEEFSGVPLASASDTECMAGEVAALDDARVLFRQSGFAVCCAPAAEIPAVLHEIGRLRELTFRAVGEGTGRALDLDSFDTDYLHLFIWNEVTRELVGAYRLGVTERILPAKGSRGLYTSTLFRYRPGFLRHLGPAIEMGRSFIRPEYQRKYQSLMLLWRGIGEFVARNPQYPVLFGPVSISREYQALSRDLMVRFLRGNNSSPWLGWQVRPTRPPRPAHAPGLNPGWFARSIGSIDDVSALVSEIERDGKGVPVLLRHYLKLNARLIAFNVDPEFSDVLDGLILVDLRRCDPRLLQRFLGEDGAKNFADFQEIRPTPHRQYQTHAAARS